MTVHVSAVGSVAVTVSPAVMDAPIAAEWSAAFSGYGAACSIALWLASLLQLLSWESG